jgi:HSP20 family protein
MALPVRHRERSTPSVERWDPFNELEDLRARMSELMASALPAPPAGNGRPWAPLVDIEETEDAWIVEAEVPGAKRDDVNVEVNNSELVVSGEIKERERVGLLRRRTRRTGEFELRVTLPGRVDAGEVEANLDDGVLTVRIPKPEDARPERVEVQSGQR